MHNVIGRYDNDMSDMMKCPGRYVSSDEMPHKHTDTPPVQYGTTVNAQGIKRINGWRGVMEGYLGVVFRGRMNRLTL